MVGWPVWPMAFFQILFMAVAYLGAAILILPTQ
jgi:hypothetical protein